jgi:hypothetical protein
MSHPIDLIDNSRTKPLRMEHDGQMSSGRLRTDVRQRIAGAAAAFLFAGLAPALVMAALWHTAKVAPIAFSFTFAVALSHAVLLGLPLFLVFQSMGWINAMSCVVFGFAVGSAPTGVPTWRMQYPRLHTNASVDGVPTIINGIITAAGGVSYIRPLIYFGSFGALGGFAFWAALILIGTFEKSRRGRRSLTSFSSQTPASREERISATPGSA